MARTFRLSARASSERFDLCDVVNPADGEADRQRIAQRVDDHMDFGREPAARAADGLAAAPFLR